MMILMSVMDELVKHKGEKIVSGFNVVMLCCVQFRDITCLTGI